MGVLVIACKKSNIKSANVVFYLSIYSFSCVVVLKTDVYAVSWLLK